MEGTIAISLPRGCISCAVFFIFRREFTVNSNKKRGLLTLTECSLMIALATVLSTFPLFEMPYGGSITLASFVPIVLAAYRHGAKVGIGTAAVASLIQMLLGLKNFSYFTTWQSLLALAVFDYIIAFTVFGLSGCFRRILKNQSLAVVTGALFASIVRYICHVISGATVWAGLSIPNEAALLYSLSYNATYMVPETIILVLSAGYIASALDFRGRELRRLKSDKVDAPTYWSILGAGLVILAALISDTVLIFSKLQNYDSGEFALLGLANVNWRAVVTVTGISLIVSALLVIIAKRRISATK